jgi:hypothetical protein
MARLTQQAAYDILLAVVGGAESLATTLGLTRQAIHAWDGVIPEKHLVKAHMAMLLTAKRRIDQLENLPTVFELRPDLYPTPRGFVRGKSNGAVNGKKIQKSA